jgi:hypothetical protein
VRCDEAAVDIDLVDEAHGTLSSKWMNREIGTVVGPIRCIIPDEVVQESGQ